MEPLQSAIVANTFTIEAAHRRLGLLQRVLETVLYSTELTEATKAAHYQAALALLGTPSDSAALTAWGSDWLPLFTQENFHAELAKLRTYIDSLPRLVLYVPAVLDDEGSALVGSWCRTTLSVPYLIDLEVDTAVMGGCAFVKDGHYYDYSFTARLHKHPQLVADVLASYAA